MWCKLLQLLIYLYWVCRNETHCRWWHWCSPPGGHRISPNTQPTRGSESVQQLLHHLLVMREPVLKSALKLWSSHSLSTRMVAWKYFLSFWTVFMFYFSFGSRWLKWTTEQLWLISYDQYTIWYTTIISLGHINDNYCCFLRSFEGKFGKKLDVLFLFSHSFNYYLFILLSHLWISTFYPSKTYCIVVYSLIDEINIKYLLGTVVAGPLGFTSA